jgi:prophage regulatory protein
MAFRILRLPRVIERVGFSRSAIYDFVSKGGFPKPVKIGVRAVGWLDSDIDAWIRDRLAKAQSKTKVNKDQAKVRKGGVQ